MFLMTPGSSDVPVSQNERPHPLDQNLLSPKTAVASIKRHAIRISSDNANSPFIGRLDTLPNEISATNGRFRPLHDGFAAIQPLPKQYAETIPEPLF